MTPTEPGFYWCKREPNADWEMARVFKWSPESKELVTEDCVVKLARRISTFNHQWPQAQWSPRIERPE